ncbi:MAG: alpha/beta hydrolase [Janthinobacterium lividum]
MKAVQELRLTLPHIELAAHAFGPEDGQPVLALHGWLDNANSFARLAPRLHGLRIVALDMAGHGFSDHRPAGASYALWDYAHDVLQAAEQLGWERFALLGHSLGAIVATLVAGAVPERIERVVLIDGIVPPNPLPHDPVARMGLALREQLALVRKRKTVHPTLERAIEARMKGHVAVSREASELLGERSLMPVPGGFTWRSDSRLMLSSPVRLSEEQALAFARAIECPAQLIIAQDGRLAQETELLGRLPWAPVFLPGGHHLHLNDEAGADLVADCINRFFAVP